MGAPRQTAQSAKTYERLRTQYNATASMMINVHGTACGSLAVEHAGKKAARAARFAPKKRG